MRELRLLPAALLTWLAVFIVLVTRQPWWSVALGVAVALAAWWLLGEALTASALVLSATFATWLRMKEAPDSLPERFVATIAATPVETRVGGWSVQLEVGGTVIRGFSPHQQPALGTEVAVSAATTPADSPAVAPIVARVHKFDVLAKPQGFTAWSNELKSDFIARCDRWLGPSTEGLVPGMVLGDTSAQDAVEKQLYVDTGLSHLSAVSGSNITIITLAAVLVVKALTLGPRIQVAAAAVTLGVYIAVVGLEPSVLRASVMGIIGLLAILGSAQAEPAHGLCIAVIALLLYDPNLATSFGFALSVSATAGLIALAPLIYRAIAGAPGPDLLKRALAVAIAAEIMTMPLVSAMSGKVLTASIPANLLAAPAVAPVTILGLLGIVFPPALSLAEPFAWWIAFVARTFAHTPTPAVPTPWAILVAAWLVWLIHIKKAHWLLLGLILLVPRPSPQTAELSNIVYLEELPPDYEAPGGVDAVVVDKPGRPSNRPHRTPGGVPILYPNRDGPVRVLIDGTQRAERGHF